MGRIEVQEGSIYSPGWHVAEEIRERYWRVRVTFENKADAEEHLAYLLADRES